MSPRSVGLLLAGLCVPLFASSALAEDWTIAKISGQAWIVSQATPAVPAAAGAVVPPGSTVATGVNARAMLVHGQDTMMLGPSTKIAVPYRPDSGLTTTVFQQTGTVDLSVEHLAVPHFSVQTPYLAAVVKGTVFKVTVTDGAANVSVQRGMVGVADLKSGEKSDVAAGQTAGVSVKEGGGLKVSGAKSKPSVQAGKPQKTVVATVQGAKAKQAGVTDASAETAAPADETDDAVYSEVSPTSGDETNGGAKNSQSETVAESRDTGHDHGGHGGHGNPNDPAPNPDDPGNGDGTPPVTVVPPAPPVTTPVTPPTTDHHWGFLGWLEAHPGWVAAHSAWLEQHAGWWQKFLDRQTAGNADKSHGKGKSAGKGKGKGKGKSTDTTGPGSDDQGSGTATETDDSSGKGKGSGDNSGKGSSGKGKGKDKNSDD